uniref:Uncharacterized protein n=1 Tax=Romanomermis culicivorax TaxID=13658 RepID=A0A915K7R5_ROMCU
MPKPWRKTKTNGNHLLPDMLHSMGGSKSSRSISINTDGKKRLLAGGLTATTPKCPSTVLMKAS